MSTNNTKTKEPLLIKLKGLNKQIAELKPFKRKYEQSEKIRKQYVEQTRLKIQQMKKELNDRLDQDKIVERLKYIFVTTTSYELRTPLTSILGYTQILSDELKDKLTTKDMQFFNQIQQSANRLNRVIDDISEMSLILSNEIELFPEIFCPDKVIKKQIQEIFLEEWNLNLKLVENFQTGEINIHLDKNRFRQVFLYILRNALKFTHEGSITITTKVVNDEYRLSIEDTGIGVRKDFILNIFDLFRQGDTGLNRLYKGLGIGLAIANNLIMLLGGRIEVESERGKGSVFTISFPIESDEKGKRQDKTIQTQSKISDLISNDKQKWGTVLILEDDWANLQFTQYLVKKINLDFVSAESGEKALKVVKEQPVDGMLVDINLVSGMSGLEFFKQVKQHKSLKDIPCIAVSANANSSDKEKFLAVGFDGYLAKPFTLSDLKTEMFKVLKKYGIGVGKKATDSS